MQFLDSKGLYIPELAQIQDSVGGPNPPTREDIKSNTAYIFEFDLEYPANIHDRDDDYPFAFEQLEIKTVILSEK